MRRVQPGNPSNCADLRRIVLFILGVLLAGALLSPPLFWLGQWVLKARHLSAGDMLSWPLSEIAKAGFERFFNRAVLISALIGLPFMIRASRGEGRVLPRLIPDRADLLQWLAGFVLAGGLLLTLGWIYCRYGVYEMNSQPAWTALGQPITAALGAGIVEEILFRGFILGLLLRSLSVRGAMFWTTFIFAIVHFLKPPDSFSLPADQVTWHSGFELIAAIGGHFGNLDFLLAEFFTLFAVGWVVVDARLTTGSLWSGIGLHGGWVFGLKYFSLLTHASKGLRNGRYLPWIGDNLKIGLAPLFVILLTGWLASLCWKQAKPGRF